MSLPLVKIRHSEMKMTLIFPFWHEVVMTLPFLYGISQWIDNSLPSPYIYWRWKMLLFTKQSFSSSSGLLNPHSFIVSILIITNNWFNTHLKNDAFQIPMKYLMDIRSQVFSCKKQALSSKAHQSKTADIEIIKMTCSI